MYKQLLNQLIRFCFVIIVLICAFFTLKYTFQFLYPFLIAVSLAFIINPIVSFLESKLKLPRSVATLIIIVSLFVFLIGTIFFILTELIQGTSYLAEKIPKHYEAFILFIEELLQTTILPYYHKFTSFFQTLSDTQQETINENIQQFTTQIASTGGLLLKNLLMNIPIILSMLPHSITIFIIIVLATFMITNDWDDLKTGCKKWLPALVNKASKKMIVQFRLTLFGFAKAQLILITITGFIVIVGLLLLKMNYAITVTLFIIVADLLPFIGTGIIFIPWIIYSFLTANYFLSIGLTIIYMITIVVRQLLEPKILSISIGIHPLAALFILFISIQIWGVTGLIIAPFLLIIISVLYRANAGKYLWEFVKG